MNHEGFTITVYVKCTDGVSRQVLAVDTEYLAALITAHWGDSASPVAGAWQLPISDTYSIVFTHYQKRLRKWEWMKQRIQRKYLTWQLNRALAKREARGQSATTISTQVPPTPGEFHTLLTSAQDALKRKPTPTPITTTQRDGSNGDDIGQIESRDLTGRRLVTNEYFCPVCGSWHGEPHRATCDIHMS